MFFIKFQCFRSYREYLLIFHDLKIWKGKIGSRSKNLSYQSEKRALLEHIYHIRNVTSTLFSHSSNQCLIIQVRRLRKGQHIITSAAAADTAEERRRMIETNRARLPVHPVVQQRMPADFKSNASANFLTLCSQLLGASSIPHPLSSNFKSS